MSWSMQGSSSRTQDFDQRLASALSSAITGVVITTTTGGSATTTAAAAAVVVADPPVVVVMTTPVMAELRADASR